MLLHSRSTPPEIAADVDVEAGHPVAHLAQREAQADARRGAIEAMVLEGADEDVALDVVEVLRQVVRQRLLDRCHARGVAGRLGRALGGRADLVELLRRAVGEHRLGQAEVVDVELLGARERDRAVEQVLELAHVAGERIAREMDERVARQARRRPDAGVAGEPLEDQSC